MQRQIRYRLNKARDTHVTKSLDCDPLKRNNRFAHVIHKTPCSVLLDLSPLSTQRLNSEDKHPSQLLRPRRLLWLFERASMPSLVDIHTLKSGDSFYLRLINVSFA